MHLPRRSFRLLTACAAVLLASCTTTVRLITLDPGHFHASLVQKTMYPEVDPVVHVYAPGGEYADDLAEHLKRIDGFNKRATDPTKWNEAVYSGPDYVEKMLAEKPGNVVVIAGNNRKKTDYILKSVEAGLNVLADKPMAINPPEFEKLKQAFATADKNHVLLYDIMTERYEIWTTLQRELAHMPAFFGEIEKGAADQPAITLESVHYFSKTVAGSPLKRPTWFFDIRQEGEGMPDVGTHLVDLVQWELFPNEVLKPDDATVLSARRWPTALSSAQFKKVTGAESFPASLQQDVRDGALQVYANGEIVYRLRGITAKVVTKWDFEAVAGGDTHYSLLRGTKARLVIRQGAEQNYKPMLYAENAGGASDAAFEVQLKAAIALLQVKYPGIGVEKSGNAWAITVPAKYDVGHEAHFAQVTENFLGYLKWGGIPEWEKAGMITKYATIMKAYEMSR